LQTSHALFLITWPLSFSLFLNTYLVLIIFLIWCLGTKSHVWFFSIWLSSSFITLIQHLSLLAWFTFWDTIMDNKANWTGYPTNFLLVCIRASLSPRVWDLKWIFLTYLDGVFCGTFKFSFSYYDVSPSSSPTTSLILVLFII